MSGKELGIGDTMHVGDVISIDGIPKKWRVREIRGEDVNLQPLNDDESVDEFNDYAGDFWIVKDHARD